MALFSFYIQYDFYDYNYYFKLYIIIIFITKYFIQTNKIFQQPRDSFFTKEIFQPRGIFFYKRNVPTSYLHL